MSEVTPSNAISHRAASTFSLSSHAGLYVLGSRAGLFLYDVAEALSLPQPEAASSAALLTPVCVQLLYNEGESELAAADFNPHHCHRAIIASAVGAAVRPPRSLCRCPSARSIC